MAIFWTFAVSVLVFMVPQGLRLVSRWGYVSIPDRLTEKKLREDGLWRIREVPIVATCALAGPLTILGLWCPWLVVAYVGLVLLRA